MPSQSKWGEFSKSQRTRWVSKPRTTPENEDDLLGWPGPVLGQLSLGLVATSAQERLTVTWCKGKGGQRDPTALL
jgi:hypothetical protein